MARDSRPDDLPVLKYVIDNLKPAARWLPFPLRQLTERFQPLASHCQFEPCFARRGEGHDKGGVEGRGRGVRWRC